MQYKYVHIVFKYATSQFHNRRGTSSVFFLLKLNVSYDLEYLTTNDQNAQSLFLIIRFEPNYTNRYCLFSTLGRRSSRSSSCSVTVVIQRFSLILLKVYSGRLWSRYPHRDLIVIAVNAIYRQIITTVCILN